MRHKIIFYPTILALTAAVISGTNNFLTKIAVTAVKDPIVFTTLKNGIVALFIIGVILIMRKWKELKLLNRKQILKLFIIGIIGGSIPFALYFTGLAKTSAINAALIHKTLFIWVLLFGIPVLKEHIKPLQWLGIAAIFGANLLIGGFAGFKYNIGEFLIVMATIFWAIENIIAKVALRDISSTIVAAARMIIGSLILLVFVVSQKDISAIYVLNLNQWAWTLLTSALLFGYVIVWYAALKYAPATYVATLLVPATLITNILSAIFVTHSFSINQVIGTIFFIAGLALMIIFARKSSNIVSIEQSRYSTERVL